MVLKKTNSSALNEGGGGDGGKAYEWKVIKTVANGIRVTDNKALISLSGKILQPAGNDASRPDIDFMLPIVKKYKSGKAEVGLVGPFNGEVKLDQDAQLGGTSWSIGGPANQVKIKLIGSTDEIDKEDFDKMKGVLRGWLAQSKIGNQPGNPFRKFINFIRNFSAGSVGFYKNKKAKETTDGGAYNRSGGEGFPLKCTPMAWETAGVNGLLKPLNGKIEAKLKSLSTHYGAKGVNYIQIGGKGLYILNADPAGLAAVGVPTINEKILNDTIFTIEVRAGRSGSKTIKGSNGKPLKVCSSGIRAQGRFRTARGGTEFADSPFSLADSKKLQALADAYSKHFFGKPFPANAQRFDITPSASRMAAVKKVKFVPSDEEDVIKEFSVIDLKTLLMEELFSEEENGKTEEGFEIVSLSFTPSESGGMMEEELLTTPGTEPLVGQEDTDEIPEADYDDDTADDTADDVMAELPMPA